MFNNKKFWLDTAERAVKTFAQALVAVFVAGITVLTVDWVQAVAVAATAALVSIGTSIASYNAGEKGTASLIDETRG